ncbi:MAG TPA: alpha/beta fold hydrolase [Gaiellaceae bacterium]|nr:alpha/beta fold hydrolase [Gaiellaceae bacterium]
MGLRGSARAFALAPVVALALAVFSGAASAAGTPCGSTPGLLCSTVVVPVDRTGTVGGTISLHVEELPPTTGPPLGAIFLLAGGPGQGSAHTFGLGTPGDALVYRFLFPGYTLVAYDDRGTGDSGLLNCPALQVSTSPTGQDLLASACASALGPQAAFYGTADHVEDLDAVRTSLGLDKIALFGVSYGTKLALAYAYAHPGNVDRLVLDSVLPTDLPDPYGANVARAMPATLAAYCANVCRAATPDFAGDVVAVANRLAAKPATGNVLLVNGRTKKDTLSGVDLLSLVVDADLNPGLAAELPAAAHAARLGNDAPLLRLHVLDTVGSALSAPDLSFGLYAATDCRDGPFPWPANSDPATRPALLRSAVAALPPGTFGPFGSWASDLGNAALCDTWPTPAGGVNLATGSLPNVPLLALSGGFDMRTPTAGAQSVVAQFPQGKLVVVPGIGHSVTSADWSGCAALAVHDWMLDPSSSDSCPRPPFLVAPIGAFPHLARSTRHATPAATFAVASKTIAEAQAAWLFATFSGSPASIPGLTSGALTPIGSDAFRLTRYGIAAGVTVSGRLREAERGGVAVTFQGTLEVAGRAAAAGTLQLGASGLHGKLGGKAFG